MEPGAPQVTPRVVRGGNHDSTPIEKHYSPDLEYGKEPPDSEECSVFIEVEIGPKGQEGADIFSFEAVTPKFLIGKTGRRWGRGLLIMDTFSWSEVEKALHKLLMHCARPTWDETAKEIAKELAWEFENYRA